MTQDNRDAAEEQMAPDLDALLEHSDVQPPEGMSYVPPGTFIMGSDDSTESDAPAHKVYLDGYFIDKKKVANADYSEFVKAAGYKAQGDWTRYWRSPGGDDDSVRGVSWQDAKAYARWKGKRLPSEAEWEKGARGTDGRLYPWGDHWYPAKAHHDLVPLSGPRELKSACPDVSPYGCFDMAGDVLEWTSSKFVPYPYRPDDRRESQDGAESRVIRGGGARRIMRQGRWINGPIYCRCAERISYSPGKWDWRGFRCAIDGPKEGPKGMVYVPKGEFIMGSNDHGADERPEHIVYLDSYFIDRYPVTNAQFAAFVEESGHRPEGRWHQYFTPETKDFPVRDVTSNDAQAYAAYYSKSLPTEAQWERAARGTAGQKYPWGNKWSAKASYVALHGKKPYKKPAPVGSAKKGASPCGVCDMAGFIWEWCQDWYAEDYYASSPITNPQGPERGSVRVVRGGGWYGNLADHSRCAKRGHARAGRRRHYGIRCVRNA